MRSTHALLVFALAAAPAAGCNNNPPNPDVVGGDAAIGMDGQGGDVITPAGGGTCAEPIDLLARGMTMGMATVFRGTTAGRTNLLRPTCATMDDGEAVFSYRVPAGVTTARVSTEGSSFDTVLYARDMCAQPAMPNDRTCSNDVRPMTPMGQHSIVYLTDLMEGQEIFLIVDGTSETMDRQSSGDFVLTVTPIERGVMGNPCRPAEEPQTMPRCNAPLGCSEGGGHDGTAICTPTVANNMPCDQSGFTNTCIAPARCSTDPTPPGGMEVPAVCALPGTRAGAECRPMTEMMRCDAPFVCGAGEYPQCVRVLERAEPCDITGANNRCPMGTMCRMTDDAGGAECR